MDYSASVNSCIRWVEQNLQLFDPALYDIDSKVKGLKSFSELCLVVLLAVRNNTNLSDEIDGFCKKVFADEFVNSKLLEYTQVSTQLIALPAAVASRFGDSRLRDEFARNLRYLSDFSIERPPHRALDICFCYRLLNLTPFDKNIDLFEKGALYCSNLFYLPHPAISSLFDFYSLTHNIFYVSDFGGKSIVEEFDESHFSEIVVVLELAIVRFIYEANLDIVSELVWCLFMLNHYDSYAVMLGLSAINSVVNEFGYLPNLEDNGEISSDGYQHYHPTLLVILLFSKAQEKSIDVNAINEREKKVKISCIHEVGQLLQQSAEASLMQRVDLFPRVKEKVSQLGFKRYNNFCKLL